MINMTYRYINRYWPRECTYDTWLSQYQMETMLTRKYVPSINWSVLCKTME